MKQTHDTHLEMVATLAGKVITTRVLEAKATAELEREIAQMHKTGVSVDDLSNASGLTIDQVRAAIKSAEGRLTSDLDFLMGVGC